MLDALNVKQAVIVGHSMGGMVASALAVKAPERLLAVIGIGPITPSEAVAESFEKRIGVVLKGKPPRDRSLETLCLLKILRSGGMESLASSIPEAATGSSSTPLQRAFIRELLLSQNAEGYASLCRVIVDAKAPDYHAIEVPFLIIAGEEDESAPLDGCKLILDSISSTCKSLKVLKRVGHWHCIEAYEEVGTAVAEFCDSLGLVKT